LKERESNTLVPDIKRKSLARVGSKNAILLSLVSYAATCNLKMAYKKTAIIRHMYGPNSGRRETNNSAA